jgi:hypothetical protein
MKTDIRTSNVNQQQLMTFAYAFSVTLMVTFALLSNILSLDTFRQAQLRSTTVGFYLIIYSCCSMFGIVMLQCRLFQLLDSLTYVPFFFICNIISGLASIFTRICLWLNGLIALQRSLHSFQSSPLLNKFRSRKAAPKQILIVIVIIFLMHVHELICRVTLPDPAAVGKYVCQIKYSPPLLILNTVFTFIHLFVPFSLNIVANCLILTSISRRKASLHQTTYWLQWMKQFRRHGHLFLAPTLAIVSLLAFDYLIFIDSLSDLHCTSTDTLINLFLCRCYSQMVIEIEYGGQFDSLSTSISDLLAFHFTISCLLGNIQNTISARQNTLSLWEMESSSCTSKYNARSNTNEYTTYVSSGDSPHASGGANTELMKNSKFNNIRLSLPTFTSREISFFQLHNILFY